jgi:hypothetical protein
MKELIEQLTAAASSGLTKKGKTQLAADKRGSTPIQTKEPMFFLSALIRVYRRPSSFFNGLARSLGAIQGRLSCANMIYENTLALPARPSSSR